MLPWTSLLLLFAMHTMLCGEELISAANQDASPTNQRRAYGNACGPAALLNAFHYGSEKWQRPYNAIPGDDSKSRIDYVISKWGLTQSKHIKGVQRWNQQQGINLVDLHDIANEMCSYHWLPKVKYEILTRKKREQPTELLKHSHERITKSLKKGLPPIICIRRYAYRDSKELKSKSWWPISAHFIVIIETSKNIESNANSYKIKYVDPYGGYIREGTIHTDTESFTDSPFLAATLPSASIGNSLVKKGEQSILSYSAIIGRW